MPESIRVLAVDDDTAVLDLTSTFLERVRDDLEVETAVGGIAALETLESADRDIDCIVCDYDMPRRDGLSVLKAVRESHPGLPFILFTGKGSEEIASEAIAAGVTDYLQKKSGPEQYEMLANRIVNAVERRRAENRATNLDRINRVIREVQQGLVAADTREEIESLVCEKFTAADPYEFSWIGQPDADGALIPRVTAGTATTELREAISSTDPETRRDGPGAVTARTGDPQVVQNIQTDPVFEPWRQVIGSAGLHSLCAVPLIYGDADYGVLLVYANRTYAFDDEELAILTELGDTIARAIDAVETSRTLDFVNELVTGAAAGIAAYDDTGEFVYVNPAFADLLEYTVDDLLDTPIWDVEPTLTPENYGRYWDSFSPDETRTLETTHLTADGDRVPVETSSTPVTIDGRTYHVGTITHIADRVANRHELEEYARRFEAVFNDPTAFIGLLYPDGRIMQVNDTALSFIDADLDDVTGVPFWETPWWAFSSDVQTDLQDRIAAAANGEFVRFEVENRGADGEPIELDTTLRPVTDDSREVVAVLAEGRDITDRKQLESALRRSKNALQDLYAASANPDAGFEKRLQDVLSMGADHLGMPMAAVTREVDADTLRIVANHGVDEMEPGDELPVTEGYRAVRNVNELLVVEDIDDTDFDSKQAERWDVRSTIGSPITIDGESSGMLWFAGREPATFSEFDKSFVDLLSRWMAVEMEIRRTTERLEEQNERLAYQNERLERFAEIVTHDLRSPLTTATGWLEVVRDATGDERLDRVSNALDRMEELIEDVRAMTWSGRTVSDPDRVPLGSVVNAAWSTCEQNGASLDITATNDVYADESRLKQLLENLFRNSIEHGSTNPRSRAHEDSVEHGSTDNRDASRLDDSVEHGDTDTPEQVRFDDLDAGRQEVQSATEGDDAPDTESAGVAIEFGMLDDGFYIADDGPGIPPDERDVVFNHGYTTTEGGTGFGLNIVAEVVAAHDWDISVTDSDTGGARFEVTGVDVVPE